VDPYGKSITHDGDKKYIFMVEKPNGKRPLGELACRWKYNIKMDHRGSMYMRVCTGSICLRIG
jgi:hypothetical protein